MAWVKLVDSEGRVAGHAVLSARISMALPGGQGLMGPPSHDSRQQRGAPSEDTISINGGASPHPPGLALAMMPPRASPMPAATGGKAPQTATGGYLQARSRCLMLSAERCLKLARHVPAALLRPPRPC